MAEEKTALTRLRLADTHIKAAGEALESDAMDTAELMESDELAFEISAVADGIKTKTRDALWERPAYRELHMRSEPPLYDPSEILPLIAQMSPLRSDGNAEVDAWQGYWFSLKTSNGMYTYRRFPARSLSSAYEDVVPASEAETRGRRSGDQSVFACRDKQERMASDHNMTLFQFLSTQTNEPTESVVALYFVI